MVLGALTHKEDSGQQGHCLRRGAPSQREDTGRKGQGAVMGALTPQVAHNGQEGHMTSVMC